MMQTINPKIQKAQQTLSRRKMNNSPPKNTINNDIKLVR